MAAVRDAGHDHPPGVVVDRVDDSVLPDPDSVIVTPGELLRATRARVLRNGVDRPVDSCLQRTVQSLVRARRDPMEPDLVPMISQ